MLYEKMMIRLDPCSQPLLTPTYPLLTTSVSFLPPFYSFRKPSLLLSCFFLAYSLPPSSNLSSFVSYIFFSAMLFRYTRYIDDSFWRHFVFVKHKRVNLHEKFTFSLRQLVFIDSAKSLHYACIIF